MNSEGIITGWNSQAEKIFGWSREEAIGRMLSETIIPPQYREAHAAGIEALPACRRGDYFESTDRSCWGCIAMAMSFPSN